LKAERGNLKIIFGTSPGELVKGNSRLSEYIDEEVKRHVEENNGVFKTIDN